MTSAQSSAYQSSWQRMGLSVSDGFIDTSKIFGKEAPCYLEIGFGDGQSLLALASAEKDHHFIGIETHLPGIGALLLKMKQLHIENIRIFHADAIDVLTHSIPNSTLDGVQIFFPDPWQKRRHHQRRLIQTDFLLLLSEKLKPGGELHLATDCEEYAKHMMRVIHGVSQYHNPFGPSSFASFSPRRPLLTKFEKRAIKAGREIREIQLVADPH